VPGSPSIRRVLQPHLDQLLSSRDSPKTICPSEVARALNREDLDVAGLLSWGEGMLEVREIVAEMRELGEVEVLQRGMVLGGDLGPGLEWVVGHSRVSRTR